jgi:foldase protein PrsA
LVRNLPFEEVARERSDGLTADDGGRRDWTTRGSLLSEKLDEAIFSLPIDSLSKIITDSTGFHIVQVTERIDVHRTPFRDAQVGIQQEIQEKRRKAQIKKYLASLREKIYVWTIFDELPAE